jgi:uncharacterized RDD family membrane protein YckC
MSPEPKAVDRIRYAAFKLRFHALLIDGFICLALFLVGGLVTGILLENSAGGRVGAFILILALALCYEPVMVARYGGTIGHRKSNIRILCARSNENLPLWRAAVRSLVKQLFGLFSFIFMFITSKAQGLHDLLADARVIIRDPAIAKEADCFNPSPTSNGPLATPLRRVTITVVYNVLLFMLLSVVAASVISQACLDRGHCSDPETSALSTVGGIWLMLAGSLTILGWTGRLPGCRSRNRQ